VLEDSLSTAAVTAAAAATRAAATVAILDTIARPKVTTIECHRVSGVPTASLNSSGALGLHGQAAVFSTVARSGSRWVVR